MPKYLVEYYKKNLMIKDVEPSGPYDLSVVTKTLEKAIVKVVKLCKSGFTLGYSDFYNAKITDSKGEDHIILRKGKWLVNLKTGKKLNLEGKLKQER